MPSSMPSPAPMHAKPLPPPRIPVIYGASTVGAPGTFCTITSPEKTQRVVDAYVSCLGAGAGRVHAIDTSNVYGFGTSEKMLAQTNLHDCAIDTKFYPLLPGDHSRTKIREAYARMRSSLQGRRVRVLYLNAPDRATPFAETLAAMNELYKDGAFEQLGLSNFRTYEVAEIVTLCRLNGWIAPTVYQGVYSAIDRGVEEELLPCLRHFNIRFAAYSPLAGGFLVGNMLFDPTLASPATPSFPASMRSSLPKLLPSTTNGSMKPPPLPSLRALQRRLNGSGSHFDPQNPFGMWYQNRYLHPRMNEAVLDLCEVLDSYDLTLHEASVRWLQHHSALLPSDLGVVFGATRAEHVRETLGYCSLGPLPPDVVDAFDDCYGKVRGSTPIANPHADPSWYSVEAYGY
ncbi:Aflatoxin B1-aldehyde reductase [Mycena kentingensis (nom. inval.)]|nr:Aflatoxin B1-aldehyde reductase [Mycena kentingensis (nom. inval.)]